MDRNNSKNEVKKKVYYEDVKDILEWIDDTVKHSLKFWNSLDGLQWSEHSQNSQRFDYTQILSCWTSTAMKILYKSNVMGNSFNLTLFGVKCFEISYLVSLKFTYSRLKKKVC